MYGYSSAAFYLTPVFIAPGFSFWLLSRFKELGDIARFLGERNELASQLEAVVDNTTAATAQETEERIVAAKDRFPSDYRFFYFHARLLSRFEIKGRIHDEAFKELAKAAEKTIIFGQTEEILNRLEREKDRRDFKRLMHGHKEWNLIREALHSQRAELARSIYESEHKPHTSKEPTPHHEEDSKQDHSERERKDKEHDEKTVNEH